MTQTEKIIALAELEGWKRLAQGGLRRPDGTIENAYYGEDWRLPYYLTSHDALQPLLEKMTEEECKWFRHEVDARWLETPMVISLTRFWLTLTPEQKADCILKACGKWKE